MDLIRNGFSSLDLHVSELLDFDHATTWVGVNESLLLHLNHEQSVLLKMLTEMILKNEKLLL